ncbi:MAG: protein required for normal CLN1 and CLN2 G1 cyclin expression [Marteilia pararefringens]
MLRRISQFVIPYFNLSISQNHLLGRAYFCLIEGERLQKAQSQFLFVLNQDPNNICAMIGYAYIYFYKKDYKSALKMFKKAIRLSPNSIEDLRVGIGHCFLKLNNVAKAKLAYERALEMNSECSQAMLGLAIINLNLKTQKSTKQGVKYLSMAYSLDPKNPMIANLLSDHFFYKKEYDKARKLSLLAFQSTDNDSIKAESSFQLGRIFHEQLNFEQAFKYYYQSTQLAHPTYLKPYIGLAQMYIKRGDLKSAQASVRKILAKHPDCVSALKLQVFIDSQNDKSEASDVKIRKNHQKILAHNPNDIIALINIAQCLEENSLSTAIEHYNVALEIISKEIEHTSMTDNSNSLVASNNYLYILVLNNIACLKFMMGKFQIALDLFLQANDHANDAKLTKILAFNIGSTKLKLGLYEDARSLFNQLLREDPESIECYLRLGNLALIENDIAEAKIQFNNVLEKNPESIDALILLAQLHDQSKELAMSQKYYDRIIKIDPKDTYTLLSLGNIWLATAHHSGEKDKDRLKRHLNRAMGYYRQVLNLDKCNAWASNGIGAVLAHKRLFNEAREVFSQVKEVCNDFSDVWLNLAHVYAETKHYDESLKLYQSYDKKFSKNLNSEAPTHMARIYLKSNQVKLAINAIQKLFILDPTNHIHAFNFAYLLLVYSTNLFMSHDTSSHMIKTAIIFLEVCKTLYAKIATLTENGQKHESASKSSKFSLQKIDMTYMKSLNEKVNSLLEQSQMFFDAALGREQNKQKEINEQLRNLQDYERKRSEAALREVEAKQAKVQELEMRRRKSLVEAQSNIDSLKRKQMELDESNDRIEQDIGNNNSRTMEPGDYDDNLSPGIDDCDNDDSPQGASRQLREVRSETDADAPDVLDDLEQDYM